MDPSKLNVDKKGVTEQQTAFTYSYPEGSKVYVVDWHGGGNIEYGNSLCRYAPAKTRIGEVYYGRSKNDSTMHSPVSGIAIDSPINVWSSLFKQWYQYTHGLLIKPTTQYSTTYTAGKRDPYITAKTSGEWDSDYFRNFDPTVAHFNKNGYLRYGGHDHRQYNDTWYYTNAAVIASKVPPNSALGY
jgi:hypothetical protein